MMYKEVKTCKTGRNALEHINMFLCYYVFIQLLCL